MEMPCQGRPFSVKTFPLDTLYPTPLAPDIEPMNSALPIG